MVGPLGQQRNGKASWEGKPHEDWEEREHPWRLIADPVTTLDFPLSFLPRLPVELTLGGLAWGEVTPLEPWDVPSLQT